jgi:hypothetical protein
MRSIIWVIILMSLGASCLEVPDCVNIRNDVVGITFKTLSTNATLDQAFDSINVDGTPLVFYPAVTASKIVLPLDYINDTTFYTLHIQDTTYHLILSYTSQPEFISEECGERFVIGSLQVAEHSFDSVNVISQTPGVDANANNIEIFRK